MKTTADAELVQIFGGKRRSRSFRLSKRAIGNLVFASIFTVVSGAWFVWLRPPALGGGATYVMVRGVSMEPTYHTGDLVIARAQPSYAIGDIVAYKVPQGDVGAGLTVIHRIIGGSPAAGYIMRGDNNPAPDDWHPKAANIEGKAWLLIPRGGQVLAFLHAPIPLAALAASVAVAMIVYGKGDQEPTTGRRSGRRSSGGHVDTSEETTAG